MRRPWQVCSSDGPAVTAIAGRNSGPATMRCVWLASGATLSGFTITNGASLAVGDYVTNRFGGGVWCETGAVVSNCVISRNFATGNSGGGAAFGQFFDCNFTSNNAAWGAGAFSSQCVRCTFVANNATTGGGAGSQCKFLRCLLSTNTSSTSYGGAYMGTLTDCVLSNNVCGSSGGGAGNASLEHCLVIGNSANSSGGGLFNGAASRCTFIGNRSTSYGGGTYNSSLTNCLLWGNVATIGGGGAYNGSLLNCTVVSNRATRVTPLPSGGGVGSVVVRNSIIQFNQAAGGANYTNLLSVNYSCTSPLPIFGTGNNASDPLFLNWTNGASLRLSAASPCLDAGSTNAIWCGTLDLDGRPRVLGSGVDMGAYEYPGSMLPLTLSIPSHLGAFSENASTVTVTAALSAPAYEDMTAGFSVSGTASAADFTVAESQFLFPAGSSNATIHVTIVDDALSENSEMAFFTLMAGDGYSVGTPDHYRLTILPNDGFIDLSDALDTALAVSTPPEAPWFGESSDAHDGVDAARSAPVGSGSASEMSVTVEGPARVGFWWKVSAYYSSWLQFMIDDTPYAYNYGQGASRSVGSHFSTVLPAGTHTLKWQYNQGFYSAGSDCGWVDELTLQPDWPLVSFDYPSQSVSEDVGDVVLSVRLDRPDTNTVTVSYLLGGTAVNGEDYTVAPTGSVSFAPGETQTNLVVSVIDDATPEHDETVLISLTPDTGALAGDIASQTITIGYNDGMVEVFGFKVNNGAGGTASRDVSLDFTGINDPTEYAAADEPTFSNAVWTAFSGTPIPYTLSPGYGEKSVWLKLRKSDGGGGYLVSEPVSYPIVYGPPLDEAIDLPGATLSTGGQNGAVWYGILDPTALGGSRAHSAAPAPGQTWASSWLTATVTNALPSLLSFVYEKVGNGSLDFTLDGAWAGLDAWTPGQHTFGTELSPGVHLLRWGSYSEAFEGSMPGYSLLDAVTLTPLPPHVWFVTNRQEVAENAGTVAVGLVLERPSDTPVTVSYSASGTAVNSLDYTLSPTGTVTFAPGETRTNFWVSVIDDTEPEHGEDAVFTLTGGVGCRVSEPSEHTLTILANDGLIDFLGMWLENGAAETTNRVILIDGRTSEPPAEGIASENPDFSGGAWFPVSSNGVYFTLSEGYGLKTVYAKVRIPKDGGGWEESNVLSNSIRRVACTLQGALDTDATVTTMPSAPWFGQLAVSHDGSDAAKSAPLDPYQYATSEMTTIVQGPAKVSFWWKISSYSGYYYYQGQLSLLDNGYSVQSIAGEQGWTHVSYRVPEGTHTLVWQFYQNYYPGGQNCGWVDSLKIQPDWPSASFAIASQTVSEDTGVVSIPISLDSTATNTVTIPYTLGGTATEGADYSLAPTGSVSFAPGDTVAYIAVSVTDDVTPEPSETVILTLAPTTGALAGDPATHTLTIASNDGAPVITSFSAACGPWTLSRAVDFSLSSTQDPIDYRVDDNASFTHASWMPFTNAFTFTVSESYGGKTVWVQVRKPLAGGGFVESDPVQKTIMLDPTLAAALGVETAETGGAANWFGQTSNTVDGAAVQSGETSGYGQTTWVRTTLDGSGTVTFKWKFETAYNDSISLTCLKDGAAAVAISSPSDWASASVTFDTPGTHTLEWQLYTYFGSGWDWARTHAYIDQVKLVGWTHPTVVTPQLSPPDGTIFSDTQEVALTCATLGAQINYTLDGSDPTTNSALYAGPLTLSNTTTVKAKAFKPGYPDSATAQATYLKSNATPLFSPPSGTAFTDSLEVSITSAVAAVSIRYTLDNSDPTAASALYADPLSMTNTSTIKARAYSGDSPVSAISSATYTLQAVGAPTFTPDSGTLLSGAGEVTLACAVPGAAIRYTLDGSEPTEASALYEGAVTCSNAMTLVRARAFKTGMAPSAISQAGFFRRGMVAAWGYNGYGQCNVPVDLTNAAAVTAGSIHSVALRSDGSVTAWGYNGYGECNVPASLSNVIAVSAGAYHTAALKANGTVTAWGYNGSGRCDAPADLTNAVAIAAGDAHTVALRADGTVAAWGYNGYNQCTVPTNLFSAVAVAAGTYHTVALRADGTVTAWGNDGNGQCTAPLDLTNAVAVAAGNYHSVALRSNGKVTAWGYNGYGQCNVPAGLSNVIAVAAIANYTAALRADGSVTAWGDNGYGQCNVPYGLMHAASLAAGGEHALVRFDDVTPLSATPASGCWIPPGTGSLPVRLLAALEGGTIRYTLDGSEPASDSAVYAGAVTVVSTTTLKARLFHGTEPSGATLSATYTKQVAAPLFSPTSFEQFIPAGSTLAVALSCTDAGVTIRYTLDGSEPTETSAAYADALELGQPSTLKTRAFKAGMIPSATSTARYALPGEVQAGGYNGYGQCDTPASLTNAVAIAGGGIHSVALRADGSVATWGNNGNGQCNVPVNLSNAVAVAAGGYHTVALRADGTAAAWGYNGYGQCNAPAELSNAVAVAAGGYHTVALRADGTVAAWGYNGNNQCNVPAELSNAVAVAAGGYHTIALRADGTVAAWGYNGYNQCNVPGDLSNVVAIAAGDNHTVALKSDGTVVAWGYNDYGQCNVPAGLTGVIAISAGANHTVALKADGSIAAWGNNDNGQCNVPTGIARITAIAAGGNHTLVQFGYPAPVSATPPSGFWIPPAPGTLTVRLSAALAGATLRYTLDGSEPASDSAAYTGAVTVASTTTLKARLFRGTEPSGATLSATYIKQVAAPLFSPTSAEQFIPRGGTLAVTLSCTDTGVTIRYTLDGSEPTEASAAYTDALELGQTTTLKARAFKDGRIPSVTSSALYAVAGDVLAWGYNGNGECTVPASLTNAVALEAGENHSVALRADGTVAAWGYNGNGQCNVPADLSNAVAVAAGGYHTVALRANGSVAAWGYNGNGQCNVPSELSTAVAVAAGYYHTVALLADGTVDAWGYNGNNQCNVPSDLSNAVAVAAGGYHTVALLADGSVTAWGYNSYGQCNVPAELSSAVAVAAGMQHTVALKADGTVAAWGDNGYGQCNVPAGLSHVIAVSAGDYFTMALQADGSVITWGYNNYGQCNVPLNPARLCLLAAGGSHMLVQFGSPSPVSATPPSGSWIPPGPGSLTVRLSAALEGGTLRCTLDGSEPASDSAAYAGGFTLAATTTLKARLFHGAEPSGATLSAIYTKRVSAPLFSPASTEQFIPRGGTLAVALSCTDAGVTLRFTLDGSEPTEASAAYTDALELGQTTTLKARAFKAGMIPSATTTALYAVLGEVRAWGNNDDGQCNVPDGLSNAVQVCAGVNNNSMALRADGTVIAWGYNGYGQNTVPPDLTNAVAVASGNYHCLALKADGTVTAWGYNGSGQRDVPEGLLDVVAIAAGYYNSVALKADGSVVVWGYNGHGQCDPQPGLTNAVAIAAGQYHIAALRSDGTVAAWGYNGNNQCSVPADLTNAVAVAAGQTHTVALRADGTVVAWGNNSYGQCTVPAGLNGIIAISAGGNSTVALKADGSVVAWGDRSYGQGYVPTNPARISALSVGNYHTLVQFGLASPVSFTPPTGMMVPGSGYPFPVRMLGVTWGGTFRYTLDNTEPTASSPAYTTPVMLGDATTVKAALFTNDLPAGASATVHYPLLPGGIVFHIVTTEATPAEAGTASGSGLFRKNTAATVTATVVNREKYVFGRWRLNGTPVSTLPVYTFTVRTNSLLTAAFDLATYPVNATVEPYGLGWVYGTGWWTYGDTNTLTAYPYGGCRFLSWRDSATDALLGTNLTYSLAVTSNFTVKAVFEETVTSHAVTTRTEPADLALVSGAGTYTNGQLAALTAPPAITNGIFRYVFQYFRLNGSVSSYSSTWNWNLSRTDPADADVSALYLAQPLSPNVRQITRTLDTPVPITDSLQVSVIFDRQMNPAYTPAVTVSNLAGTVTRTLPATNTWTGSYVSGDTYRCPAFGFARGEDGDYVLTVSGARDTYDGILAPTNAWSFRVDATPPPVPVLHVTGSNDTSFTVGWAGYAPPADLNGFRIYVSEAPFTSRAALSPIGYLWNDARSYTYSPIQLDTTYWIAIVPQDLAGNMETDVTPLAVRIPRDVPPAVPFTVTATGAASARLDWPTYAGDSLGFAEFRIYRDAVAFSTVSNRTPVATVDKHLRTYAVTGLDRSVTNWFSVVGFNARGESVDSVVSLPWADPYQGVITNDMTIGSDGTVTEIFKTLTVQAGATLTVPAGATLAFHSAAGITVENGALRADGTALKPIHFTSAETNAPAAGDWDGVTLLAQAGGSLLRHVWIEYGKGLTVGGCAPTVDACTARYNAPAGFSVLSGGTLATRDALLVYNAAGIRCATGATGTLSRSIIRNNATNALALSGAALTATNVWWGSAELATLQGGLSGTLAYTPFMTTEPVLTPAADAADGNRNVGVPSIVLALAGRVAETVQISEDSHFAGAFYDAFEPLKTVALSEGGGIKTLYVRFRNASGQVSQTVTIPVAYITGGPLVNDCNIGEGDILTRPFTLTASALSGLGIATLRVLADDTVVAATNTASLSARWDTRSLSNGTHRILVEALDVRGNLGTRSFNVTASLQPPPSPVLTAPAEGLLTTNSFVTATGTAEPFSTVSLRNGRGSAVSANAAADGAFSASVPLAEGKNILRAIVSEGSGTGYSNERNVTCDQGSPNPVTLETPVYRPGTGLQFGWLFPAEGEKTDTVSLLRSEDPITTFEDATWQGDWTKDNPITTVPPADGRWYFALIGRDAADNRSLLSNVITNDYDGTAPSFAVAYDKASPCGLGYLRITVVSSETLTNLPTVTVQPPAASGPTMLTVSNAAPNRYVCTYNVQSAAGSGTLTVRVSGTDLAGNRATAVAPTGMVMALDTRAPAGFLSTTPSGLIQVTNSLPLIVSLTLDEIPSGSPTLRFMPPEGAQLIVALTGGGTNWNGQLELLPTMGSGVGSFTLGVNDALGNAGTRLGGATEVELYNTALPTPPKRVTDLRASTDQAGGVIKLAWGGVDDAESYTLYRQAGEFGTTPDQLIASNILAAIYSDLPAEDDFYRYVVTSVRRGSAALPSPVARGISDRTPPPTPQNLTASLSSSGVRVEWEYSVSGVQPEYFRVYRNGTLLLDRVSAATRFILDNPAAGTWSYAVSSVDHNGNEALSNSSSIDMTLPAVTRTDVTVGTDLVPHLTWQVRAEHVGVNLYRNGVKLNATPLAGTSFSDSGLSGSGVTRYEVRGVNADGDESAGRQLPVYHLSCGFAVNPEASGTALLRYFDRCVLTVSNRTAGAAFAVAQLDLTRAIEGGGSLARTAHVSQSAPAGGATAVGVTFPCATAPGVQSFTATVVQALEDPSASVHYEATFAGGTPSLASVQINVIVTNQTVAGAACKPQARFYNPSQVPVDLVMWRNGQPGDVTIRVLDAHGTEANRADVVMTRDDSDHNLIIPTADGLRAFLRIPAKGSTLVTLSEIVVPEALGADASAFIEVRANNIYTSCGEAGEEISGPLQGRLPIMPSPTPYTAYGVPERAAYLAGETLVVTGYAFDRVTGARTTNVAVNVGIALDGHAWYVAAQTDAQGNFRAEWPISDGISGLCQVWASHPLVKDRLNQGETAIYQAYFSPQEGSVRTAANDPMTIRLNVYNPGSFTFTNLTSSFTAWQVTDGVTNVLPLAVVSGAVSQVESLTLHAKQQTPVTLTLFASEDAMPSFDCRFELITPEGLHIPFDATVSVSAPLPLITIASPANGYVNMSLDRDKSRTVDVELRNDGYKTLQGVKMTAPTIPWMSVSLTLGADGQFALPDIAPGRSYTFQVRYEPDKSVAMDHYSDALMITGTNTVAVKTLHLYALVTSEQRGTLFFHVANSLGQVVPDASVRLRNALDGTDQPAVTTDENGDVEIAGLMEGRWYWQVSASGHGTQAGTSQVEAKATTEVDPVLSRELVSVSFTVVPVPFTDRYEIKIEQTFSTYVPAPVLIVDPLFQDLGIVTGPFESTFTATAKNYGLIKLTQFSVSGSQSTVGSLVPAISYLPVLAPMQQIEIPFAVSYWGDAGAPVEPLSVQSANAAPVRQATGVTRSPALPSPTDASSYDLCTDFAESTASLTSDFKGRYGTETGTSFHWAEVRIGVVWEFPDSPDIPFVREYPCLVDLLTPPTIIIDIPTGPGDDGGDGPDWTVCILKPTSSGCFAAGTQVRMADGTDRAIEDVKPGDAVRTGPRKDDLAHVSETYRRGNVAIRELTLGNGTTLRTTAEHRIWVDSRGWTLAKDIRAGDRVACLNDTTAAVLSATTTDRAETVYTLELREDFAFYAQGVLVRHLCGMQFPNLTPTHGTKSRTKGGAQ